MCLMPLLILAKVRRWCFWWISIGMRNLNGLTGVVWGGFMPELANRLHHGLAAVSNVVSFAGCEILFCGNPSASDGGHGIELEEIFEIGLVDAPCRHEPHARV